MGTNFYWKKSINYEEPERKWQKELKEKIKNISDLTHENIYSSIEEFIRENSYSIDNQETRFSREEEESEYERHIGKRSAAGPYCWDCDITLCRGGNEKIHYGSLGDKEWYKECPKCGKSPQRNDDKNPVMVELGFSKPKSLRPVGVQGCCSFTWAEEPEKTKFKGEVLSDTKVIVDEYGEEFTYKEFLEMLESNCPVTFTNSINTQFS